MTRTVLVVGEPDDLHVDTVAGLLAERGVRVLLFDFVRQPAQGGRLCCGLDTNGVEGALRVDGRWYDLSEVDAVWWRVKLVEDAGVLTCGGSASDFALREWLSALDSLEGLIPHACWTNKRTAAATARLKPVQLRVAAQLGLAVPRTLISNDPDRLAAFVGAKASVYKVLTWFYERPHRMIFTSEVAAADVAMDPDAVRMAPCLVQDRVPKDHELRVVVVGQHVLAVRIDSQRRPETRVDWRRNQHALGYRHVHLSRTLEDALIAMNARLDLRFGAYDLIVTPSADVVFLEVNPMGQWLWLERACGVPISAAVSDHLAGR